MLCLPAWFSQRISGWFSSFSKSWNQIHTREKTESSFSAFLPKNSHFIIFLVEKFTENKKFFLSFPFGQISLVSEFFCTDKNHSSLLHWSLLQWSTVALKFFLPPGSTCLRPLVCNGMASYISILFKCKRQIGSFSHKLLNTVLLFFLKYTFQLV